MSNIQYSNNVDVEFFLREDDGDTDGWISVYQFDFNDRPAETHLDLLTHGSPKPNVHLRLSKPQLIELIDVLTKCQDSLLSQPLVTEGIEEPVTVEEVMQSRGSLPNAFRWEPAVQPVYNGLSDVIGVLIDGNYYTVSRG